MSKNSISKSIARKQGQAYRASIDAEFLTQASLQIAHSVEDCLDWSTVDSVHIYHQIEKNKEVSTVPIIRWLNDTYPDIFVHVQSNEPDFPDDMFDVVIMPVVAIDELGNRVGYGGGSYDTYLAEYAPRHLIALSFEGQVIESIDAEDHDVRPHLLITEAQVRHF